MHILLELAAALVATIPLYATARAYYEGGSTRLVLAFAAFSVLEVRFLAVLLIHVAIPIDHPTEELLDFGGDLIVMSAFAAAFLWGARWSHERVPLGTA
jgi:ABC-type amino acid transport system permease subunit